MTETELSALKEDVESVLNNTPHETASPGDGIMGGEEYEIEVRDGAVVIEWERTWSGSGGSYGGVLSRYFEMDHTQREDGSGGEITITGRTETGESVLGGRNE